ncbi:MAG: MarR family transcriptional regulator [Anaerolineaceae bacterium]
MHDHHSKPDPEAIRAHMRAVVNDCFGVQDSSGIELLSTLRMVGNLLETMDNQQAGEEALSGPRMHLMMRLFAEEKDGNLEGLTPTTLSRCQRVSKNTISSLLRGLEEQGLIQRNLDPQDYRIFRIQLTPAGRDLLHRMAPQRLQRMNELAGILEPEERTELMHLLGKLQVSLLERLHEHKEKSIGG